MRLEEKVEELTNYIFSDNEAIKKRGINSIKKDKEEINEIILKEIRLLDPTIQFAVLKNLETRIKGSSQSFNLINGISLAQIRKLTETSISDVQKHNVISNDESTKNTKIDDKKNTIEKLVESKKEEISKYTEGWSDEQKTKVAKVLAQTEKDNEAIRGMDSNGKITDENLIKYFNGDKEKIENFKKTSKIYQIFKDTKDPKVKKDACKLLFIEIRMKQLKTLHEKGVKKDEYEKEYNQLIDELKNFSSENNELSDLSKNDFIKIRFLHIAEEILEIQKNNPDYQNSNEYLKLIAEKKQLQDSLSEKNLEISLSTEEEITQHLNNNEKTEVNESKDLTSDKVLNPKVEEALDLISKGSKEDFLNNFKSLLKIGVRKQDINKAIEIFSNSLFASESNEELKSSVDKSIKEDNSSAVVNAILSHMMKNEECRKIINDSELKEELAIELIEMQNQIEKMKIIESRKEDKISDSTIEAIFERDGVDMDVSAIDGKVSPIVEDRQADNEEPNVLSSEDIASDTTQESTESGNQYGKKEMFIFGINQENASITTIVDMQKLLAQLAQQKDGKTLQEQEEVVVN